MEHLDRWPDLDKDAALSLQFASTELEQPQGSRGKKKASASVSEAGVGSSVPAARTTQACTGCRSAKIKCCPNPATNIQFPCKRCVSMGITCEVLKHNRGRKRKNPLPETDPNDSSIEGVGSAKKKQATYYPTDSASLAALASTVAVIDGPPEGVFDDNQLLSQSANAFEYSDTQSSIPPSAQMGESPVVSGNMYGLPLGPVHPVLQLASSMPLPLSVSGNIHSPSLASHSTYSQQFSAHSPIVQQSYATGSESSVAYSAGPHLYQGYTGATDPDLTYGVGNAHWPSAQFATESGLTLQHPLLLPQLQTESQVYPQQLRNAVAQQENNTTLSTSPERKSSSTMNDLMSIKFPFLHEVQSRKVPTPSHPAQPQTYHPEPAVEKLCAAPVSPASSSSSRKRGLFVLRHLADEAMRTSQQAAEEEIGPSKTRAASYLDNSEYLLAHDPITAGILSPEDSKILFKLFVDEVDAMTCLLDPELHSHDYVRQTSPFLYISILFIVSRYLNTTIYTNSGSPRKLTSPIHIYCRKSVHAHLKGLLDKTRTMRASEDLGVVQALAALAFMMSVDADDDAEWENTAPHAGQGRERSCVLLERAIDIARVLGLDQAISQQPHLPSAMYDTPVVPNAEKWDRAKHRIWLSLFVANIIHSMQFDMATLISPDELSVYACPRLCHSSPYPTDTLLVTSVTLRRLWHIYSSLIKSLREVHEPVQRLQPLQALARRMNKELQVTTEYWKQECIIRGLQRVHVKIDVWLAAIKLKLNLAIVQLAVPAHQPTSPILTRLFPPNLTGDAPESVSSAFTTGSSKSCCVDAFHHSIVAACTILRHMVMLEEKRLLSFSADTFLHFAIYSAFFLWTLCLDDSRVSGSAQGTAKVVQLQHDEIKNCRLLIDNAAKALEKSSLYPGDPPLLHAKFLRTLIESLDHVAYKKPASQPEAMAHPVRKTRRASNESSQSLQQRKKTRRNSVPSIDGGSHPSSIPLEPIQLTKPPSYKPDSTGHHIPRQSAQDSATSTVAVNGAFNLAKGLVVPLPGTSNEPVGINKYEEMQRHFLHPASSVQPLVEHPPQTDSGYASSGSAPFSIEPPPWMAQPETNDSFLTADWDIMQRDFPWASNDLSGLFAGADTSPGQSPFS